MVPPPQQRVSNKTPRRREDLVDFEQFMWLPRLLYKFVGFDFLEMSRKSRWLQHTLNVYLACEIGSHLFCKYYLCKELWELLLHADIANFVTVTPYTFFGIDSSIKFVAIVVNMKRLRGIYHTLDENYPQTVAERRSYQVNRHYLPKWVRYTIYCYLIACAFLIYSPLFVSIGRYAYDTLTLGDAAQFAYLKAYPIAYDFDYRSMWRFLLISVIELLNANITTASTMSSDLLLICYTAQICMHLDAIGRMLEHHEPCVESVQKDCGFLAELVRKHQIMFTLHNEINACFGVGLLFNLMNTIIVLCTVAAQLTHEESGMDFLKHFTFMITAAGQFYLVCYYGQRLINTSQHISAAAFGQKWFNGSNAYKKLLLIIIMRAQKQAELSAKGFQHISLDTFQIVMTMTYRFFALIKTMLE